MRMLLLLLLSGACKSWTLRCQNFVLGRDQTSGERMQEISILLPRNNSKMNIQTKYEAQLNKTNSAHLKSFNSTSNKNLAGPEEDWKSDGISFPKSAKYVSSSDSFPYGNILSLVLPFQSSTISWKHHLSKRSTSEHRTDIAVGEKKWTKLIRSAEKDSGKGAMITRTENTKVPKSKLSSKKNAFPPDCEDKQDLDDCLDKALLNLSVEGLPHTKDQLTHVCSAFKRGMRCVDAFTSRCFTDERRSEFNENLAGARAFLAFLCDDPVFQRDYLSHGSCIGKVGPQWQGCNDRFKYLVGKELRKIPSDLVGDTRSWKSICCLREKFLSCVYHVGLSYCEREDAVFLRKVSSSLSHNSAKRLNCHSATACSGAPRNETPLQLVLRWSLYYFQFWLR